MYPANFVLRIALIYAAVILSQGSRALAGQTVPPTTPGPPPLTLDAVVGRAAAAEAATLNNLKAFRPVIEAYVQRVTPDSSRGLRAMQDTYVLGRFNWREGPRLRDLNGRPRGAAHVSALGLKRGALEFNPDGFAAAVVPDWRGLDSSRYTFSLVRRELLGEVRCFVLDVAPKKKQGDGFAGRIWVDDRDFNIVRFNGINRRAEREFFGKQLSLNMDSWRTSVLPGLWLPSYIYIEEMSGLVEETKPRVRAQVRLWGFDPRKSMGESETVIAAAIDSGAQANVLQRLVRANLLATRGAVEQVLDTVVRNLQVANDLAVDSPVTVRVLLSAPFESFTVGHTIVVSRGLIDVLPDEPSLALMLAHELAHVALGHALTDEQFSLEENLPASDDDLLRGLTLRRTQKEEAAANKKALELVGNTPYRDKLAGAAAFLKTVAGNMTTLPNLIQATIADRLADSAFLQTASGPGALPPGARLVLDPWSSRLSLVLKAAQVSEGRGLAPLVIVPLFPHLEYVEAPPLDYRP